MSEVRVTDTEDQLLQLLGLESLCYDYDNKPIDLLEWGRLFGAREEGQGQWTTTVNGHELRTVYIGRDDDEALGAGPKPPEEREIWHSVLLDRDCELLRTYPTAEAARRGHEELVEALEVERGNTG